MELTEILIIVSAIVIIILFWITVGYRHLKHLLISVEEQWEFVSNSLRERYDLLPNLVETVRMYEQGREELLERLIKQRALIAREYEPSSKKVEYEYDLMNIVREIFRLAKDNPGLMADTNFLELRKEIRDQQKEAEMRTKKYNEMVRYYNSHRKFPLLKPVAMLFNYEHLNIFEM